MGKTAHEKRYAARHTIVGVANGMRQATNQRIIESAQLTGKQMFLLRPLGMRHIERAVCMVRRHKAVKPKVLEAAGFRAA